jgi:hypothetical protein
MTTFTTLRRTAMPALALAALLPLSPQAFAVGGQWDSALAVTGSAGTGNGATSATPWIATPAAGASYAEWNFFNSYPTDNTPDIAGGGASVTENTGMAFLTSGGNIYSFAAATDFTVAATAVAGAADVWLRIGILGNLPLTTATLNGVSAQAVETYSGDSGSSFGGAEKEWFWTWSNVSAPSYSFNFGAVESSMSLDQLAVYAAAAPVPEPEAAMMLAAGLAALGFTARRRGRMRG